ncbi:DUF6924 domain-containing protein [Streptomyces sp. NPDC088812]|uniref:DUF6924 domain-containing protein n=1 Tax=Streptomyces sp. NPDC088812 TaxID=3365905 RepID=UPI0037FA451D
MNTLPQSEATLLIRTDFSDEAAWQNLCAAVTVPAGDEGGEDGFLALLHIVDDPAYQGLTTEQVVELAPEEDALLVVADGEALTGADMPLLAVYLGGDEDDGTTGPGFEVLRVVATELWSVENNISLANMDWEEFVDAAGKDGVFRGF